MTDPVTSGGAEIRIGNSSCCGPVLQPSELYGAGFSSLGSSSRAVAVCELQFPPFLTKLAGAGGNCSLCMSGLGPTFGIMKR